MGGTKSWGCQKPFWGCSRDQTAEPYSASPPIPPIFQLNTIKAALYGKQTVFPYFHSSENPCSIGTLLHVHVVSAEPQKRLLPFTHLASVTPQWLQTPALLNICITASKIYT